MINVQLYFSYHVFTGSSASRIQTSYADKLLMITAILNRKAGAYQINTSELYMYDAT